MIPLLVLLTFVAFLIVEAVLLAQDLHRARTDRLVTSMTAPRVVPAGLFLDAGHTWVGLDPSGSVTVGADGFVASSLGRVDGVVLPREGLEVVRGERLFSLAQGLRTCHLLAPVDGVVAAVNHDLLEYAGALTSDPYGMGWVVRLWPSRLAANLDRLRVADEARAWIQHELERLQEFLALRPLGVKCLGAVSPDGGELAHGPLEHVDEETWNLFSVEFLRNEGPRA